MSDEKKDFPYLHGYSKEEQDRLRAQARFAEHTVYQDINFSGIKDLLEVGSGVGAQSEILLRRFPQLEITGIDLNEKQLEAAREYIGGLEYLKSRVSYQQMDASNMDFKSNSFEGAFLCWILEHVPSPKNVLSEVRRVLKPGSRVYITEVLNSSFFLEPYSPNVWTYWMKFNDFQYENAGDPFVGAKLGNLLMSQGFKNIKTEIKTWHLDNRRPEMRKDIIEFWTDLLMSGKETLVREKVIEEKVAQEAYTELKRVANDPDSVFLYSFMQASATV